MTYPFAGTIKTKLTTDEEGKLEMAWSDMIPTPPEDRMSIDPESGDLRIGSSKTSAHAGKTGTPFKEINHAKFA